MDKLQKILAIIETLIITVLSATATILLISKTKLEIHKMRLEIKEKEKATINASPTKHKRKK